MKLFFTASIHGKKKYSQNYQKIIELARNQGHTVKVIKEIEDSSSLSPSDSKNREQLTQRVNEIKKCDAVLAELSYNSTSAGYIVSQAVAFGKPVAIFFSGDEEPHLLSALEETNDKLAVTRYKNLADLETEVPLMLDFVAEAQDTRFNFFVSPSIVAYLDWVSKNKRIPRAVYLRKLMDKDIETDEEYQSSVD